MQPDLISLEITKGELRRLTGFAPDDILLSSVRKNRKQQFEFFMNEILVGLALTPLIVGFIYAFIILPTLGSSIVLGIILSILTLITVVCGRWLWRYLRYPKILKSLVDEVNQYHAVIQAIHVHDQLMSTDNGESKINDRNRAIAALQFIREDLVRALKTERILRDNKKLLADNQELFVNNLTNVQALQVSNQASEYARLLSQSLQIAVDVQAEIRKLQSPR